MPDTPQDEDAAARDERLRNDPAFLAADEDQVDAAAPEVDEPTEQERLEHLAGAGWTADGPPTDG
jgi:hypothetical protein